MTKLRVTFTYSGWVDIECSKEEYEALSTPSSLVAKAESELESLEHLYQLNFDGFDFVHTAWVDDDE